MSDTRPVLRAAVVVLTGTGLRSGETPEPNWHYLNDQLMALGADVCPAVFASGGEPELKGVIAYASRQGAHLVIITGEAGLDDEQRIALSLAHWSGRLL